MATLVGFSRAIVVGNGATGRCGPGVQLTPDPPPPGCGITDCFDRTVASGWGTSDFGRAWYTDGYTTSVNGTNGLLSIPPTSAGEGAIGVNTSTGAQDPAFYLPVFTDMTVTGQIVQNAAVLTITMVPPVGGPAYLSLSADFYDTGEIDFYDNHTSFVTTTLGWHSDVATRMRIVTTSTTTAALYVWQASGSPPGSPTLTLTAAGGFLYGGYISCVLGVYNGAVPTTASYTNLDIVGVS